MARRLFGYLGEDGTYPSQYYDIKNTVSVDADDVEAGDELVLFADGTAVAMIATALPARSDREARQAAPFAIEDDIASDIDDIHIALGPKPQSGTDPRDLFIVTQTQMELWTQAIAELPSKSVTLVAEQSVAPTGKALVLHDRVIGAGSAGAFVADSALGEDFASYITEGLEKIYPASDGLAELSGWFEALDEPTNLLQGNYRRKGSAGKAVSIGPWRVPIVLAAALGVAWFAGVQLETQAYKAAAESVDETITAEYRKAFPDEPAPSNAVRAISRKLGGAAAADPSRLNFLQTTAALYEAVDQLGGAQLRSMRFDPDRGGLFASMTYEDYGYDAELKEMLEDFGFAVRIGDARLTDDGVQGDVVVEGLQ